MNVTLIKNISARLINEHVTRCLYIDFTRHFGIFSFIKIMADMVREIVKIWLMQLVHQPHVRSVFEIVFTEAVM